MTSRHLILAPWRIARSSEGWPEIEIRSAFTAVRGVPCRFLLSALQQIERKRNARKPIEKKPPRPGSRVLWSDLAFAVREAGLGYKEIDRIDLSGLYYDEDGKIRNVAGAPIEIRATDDGVLID